MSMTDLATQPIKYQVSSLSSEIIIIPVTDTVTRSFVHYKFVTY